MEGDVNADILDLLALSALTLATAGRDGQPHAAAVYFAADENLRLYFFSDPLSQHGQDIAYDPRAAVAIYPECRGWEDIRGLQMRGEVRLVSSQAEWQSAWQKYLAKFPFVSALGQEVAQNALYVFIPRWVRWMDNRRGFGFKREWELP